MKKKSLFLSIIAVVVLAIAPIINATEDVNVSSSHYGDLNWHYITTSNSITSPALVVLGSTTDLTSELCLNRLML